MGIKPSPGQFTLFEPPTPPPPVPTAAPLRRATGRRLDQLLSADEIFADATAELLVRLREDRRIERKPPTYSGSALAEYVCMWANDSPEGGLIVVGQGDDGTLIGCKHLPQKRLNDIDKVATTFCPDADMTRPRYVEVVNPKGEQDFVILIRVKYNRHVVAKTTKGKVFVRDGDSKRELKPNEIAALQSEKGERSREREPCHLDFPRAFDTAKLETFAAAVRKQLRSAEPLTRDEALELKHLGEIKNDSFEPNYACGLLFAKNPRILAEGCRVHFLQFSGEEELIADQGRNVTDQQWIEGAIPDVIAKTADLIEGKLRRYQVHRDGKFEIVPEYPKDAWHEAIVNACAHRSYAEFRNLPVVVKMFENRLVVESPGGFPPGITPKNIYYKHSPRNPIIMDALFLFNYVRCCHEGTRRMKRVMLNENLPEPVFQQSDEEHETVVVTLQNNAKHRREWMDADLTEIVGRAVFLEMTDHEKTLVNWIAANGPLSVSQGNRIIGGTWPRCKAILMGLVGRGILRYETKPQPAGISDKNAKFVLNR